MVNALKNFYLYAYISSSLVLLVCLIYSSLTSQTGGWIGYFSYDTVRYMEKKKLPFFSAPDDDRNLADIHLGLYDDVIVFDHVEKVLLTKEK